MAKKSKSKDKKPVEVVVFEDPLKRRQRNYDETVARKASEASQRESVRPEFNQKSAKYDIRKLAMTGMEKGQKEKAMTDFLVELGAKRPKPKHISIKEFMQQDAEKRKLEGGSDKPKSKLSEDDDEGKKPKTKRKRDKDDILDFVDGQIGTYKKGVQFLKGGKKKRRK